MQVKILIADGFPNREAFQNLETNINAFLEEKESFAVNHKEKPIKLVIQELKSIVLPGGMFAVVILWTYEEQGN